MQKQYVKHELASVIALPQQEELLKAEARRRVNLALQQIEAAQNMLSSACSTLSSLEYAIPEWQATSKLYDRVKSHWYKVDGSLRCGAKASKVQLDSTNAAGLLQRTAQQLLEASQGAGPTG